MGVEIVTLEAKPVEQATEFVGTIKSRRSTNVQPQVEGYLTRISVKSGDRVVAGAALMEIDSQTTQAAIASLQPVRAQRDIDVTYARQEADRQAKLLAAGAASQMDADRAANALNAAEAQVRTVDEQLRQLRTDLAYYHVTVAPAVRRPRPITALPSTSRSRQYRLSSRREAYTHQSRAGCLWFLCVLLSWTGLRMGLIPLCLSCAGPSFASLEDP